MITKDTISSWAKNRWQGKTLSNIIDNELKREPSYHMKPANDGKLWTIDQELMVYEAFVNDWWDTKLVAFYLADLLQKTVGAILWQKSHIFDHCDSLHRNKLAAQLNARITRRGL